MHEKRNATITGQYKNELPTRMDRNGNRYSSKRSYKSLRSKKSLPIIPHEVKNRFENDEKFDRYYQFNTTIDDREQSQPKQAKPKKVRRKVFQSKKKV